MSSLYHRLAVVLLLVFIALASLLFWLYESSSKQLQLETSQKLHMHMAHYLEQDIDLFTDDKLNPGRVKEAFRKAMNLDPATELYVIDPQGKVLVYDAPEEKILSRQIDIGQVKAFLAEHPEFPVFGDDPRSNDKKIFSVAPIYNSEHELTAYLYIIIGGEIYQSIATTIKENKIWRNSLVIMGAGFAFLLASTLLLFYSMTKPLGQLGKEMAAFEQSDFTELPAGANKLLAMDTGKMDEIKHLQGSFYRMGQHIIEQLEYLNKHDALRREFLVHVSHDIRTPLAGMRAYLETLQLKGDALKPEDRKAFIEKALLTNTRLSGMLNELFELARLEHGQVKIHPEVLRITDLLSDIYVSLSPLAEENDVMFEVKMQQQDLCVIADLERLDRVLQNLILNAIHYTPLGGKVTVQIFKVGRESVMISIKDTGVGLSKEELPYIFEPYYRANQGEKVFKEGQGLGLAITQRLLKLHRSELTVKSKINKGTVFSFLLARGDIQREKSV